MSQNIEALKIQLLADIESFKENLDEQGMQNLKAQYLGKKGSISGLMKTMGTLSPEKRPVFGKSVNELRDLANSAFKELAELVKQKSIQASFESSSVDQSLPGKRIPSGAIHPLNRVKEEIMRFFGSMGFQIVLGREIETDWYNFEALNIPPEHPARDMQDTFYVADKVVLRTQTSNLQIHTMESQAPPLKVIAPGIVYRADSDASHAPMFQQVEGLVVDEDISFADLKGTLYLWVQHMFGDKVKLRFRPSFFPFTEPSAEMDVTCTICGGKGCRVCSQTGWLEIGGCGCVDPNVFEYVKYDPEKYTGFAFGFGIDRITMIKYGIPEIGLLTSNDMRFLRQF